jgi:hypothetical protein
VHIRAFSGDIDASGSFLGISEGARIPCVTVKQRDFLVFRDFDDVVVFPGLGMADKSCSEHIAGTLGVH